MTHFKLLFSPGRFTLAGRLSKMLAVAWAVLCYLIEPDAAFMAVMILVGLDLISKLTALSVKRGGLVDAVRQGDISSKTAFAGTCVKLVAYFSLGVLAVQVRYVALSEVAATLSKTVIYGFLFMVEAISILENLVEAGMYRLAPILDKLKDHQASKETDL